MNNQPDQQREQETGWQYSCRVASAVAVATYTYAVTRDTNEAKTTACSVSDNMLGEKLSWANGKPKDPENLDRLFGIRSQDPKNNKDQ